MFKYTPKQQIIREMYVSPANYKPGKELFKRQAILKAYGAEQSYTMSVVLQTDYKDVCYCSPTRVRQVPVRGYLFPVDMFDETVV